MKEIRFSLSGDKNENCFEIKGKFSKRKAGEEQRFNMIRKLFPALFSKYNLKNRRAVVMNQENQEQKACFITTAQRSNK